MILNDLMNSFFKKQNILCFNLFNFYIFLNLFLQNFVKVLR